MENDSDDDSVILVESTSDLIELETPSTSRKRSNNEIIEILDSDEDDQKIPVKRSKPVDVAKIAEVQAAVSEIIHQFEAKITSSKPTESFQHLRQLLEISSHATGDFLAIRAKVVESGVVQVILNCLSTFTHHVQETVTTSAPEPSTSKARPGKARKRWSLPKTNNKGVGYGSGATNSQWDVKKAQEKQKQEDEMVTAILQLLASFINPQDDIPTDAVQLPPLFIDLLEQSCLLSVLRSFMRNDSILDMTLHIPLYKANLLLIRAVSTCNQLVHLLMLKDETEETIADMLGKIKGCTEIYASRITADADDDPEINFFIVDINQTSMLVESATYLFNETKRAVEPQLNQSIETKYKEVMKPLQFDSYEIVNGGSHFTVAYNYEPLARKNGTQGSASRVKRLAQEFATLATSLPLSLSSSVFVRADTNRLDIMKFLITGPVNTPYENGCFLFDVYFPPEYPNAPPLVNLETTGRHTVRFNPNLYACGKVCLSLLNTWNGRPEERWNSATSSFLQVLVSIQSLILVDDPYFNEPGYQGSQNSAHGKAHSSNYNKALYPSTITWAMLDVLRNPVPCFKDIIQRHFWLKRNEIMRQIDRWTAESKASPLMANYRTQLAAEFLKLPVPEGLEGFEIDTPEMNRKILEELAMKPMVSVTNAQNSLFPGTNFPALFTPLQFQVTPVGNPLPQPSVSFNVPPPFPASQTLQPPQNLDWFTNLNALAAKKPPRRR